jgi:lipoprotein-anchoring transpeptidase ErfK/SrfK
MGQSVYSQHRNHLLAMTASVALLAGLATPAHAFPFDVKPRPAAQPMTKNMVVAAREKPAAAAKEEPLSAKAKGLLTVIISIDKQQLTLYSDGVPVTTSRVSTGTPGHPTPTGVFSVIQKDRWHRSNLYGNAPMFYMQRITWSGVAMHQGIVPNHPASHGCIRLPEAFARQMWTTTQMGARVIIARSEVTPAPIAHAKLFTIKREDAEPKFEAKLENPASQDAQSAYSAYTALTRGTITSDAVKPGDPALDAMAYATVTPRDAASGRRTKWATNDAVPEARPLKPGPIAVFVSRKEGKVFVRKGFEPVFSAPVTFDNPDQPLGTHVYTAIGLTDDKTTLRWNVVSMPGSGAAAPAVKKVEKGKRGEPVAATPAPTSSNAKVALDRINIPQDALDRISELMSPGASLIISDQGLGPETGKGTDFIVLTR